MLIVNVATSPSITPPDFIITSRADLTTRCLRTNGRALTRIFSCHPLGFALGMRNRRYAESRPCCGTNRKHRGFFASGTKFDMSLKLLNDAIFASKSRRADKCVEQRESAPTAPARHVKTIPVNNMFVFISQAPSLQDQIHCSLSENAAEYPLSYWPEIHFRQMAERLQTPRAQEEALRQF